MAPQRRGVYPGSFNPPTRAHLTIAEAACQQYRLDEVVWAVSTVPLAKEHVDRPRFDDRLAVLHDEAAAHPWLAVTVTEHQLIADIAVGFDVVVMGADKWVQIHDERFYADAAARDASVASLPTVAIAPRHDHPVADHHLLDVPDWVAELSSTDARQGDRSAMTAAARRFDEQTGAWTDPARYEAWIAGC